MKGEARRGYFLSSKSGTSSNICGFVVANRGPEGFC